MNVLDLFSGIGGFSLGLERAGFKTVAFCEIDPFCRQVLRKHWPDVPIYEDVNDVNRNRLEADGVGGIDVITGGFPCQDLSVAGRQDGIDGKRSGLWSEQCRIIGELRPQFAIVENVTALLSGDNGKWFGRVLRDLAEIGFDAEWHCIPASAVSAIHSRDRAWVIAYPDEKRCNYGRNSRFGGYIQKNLQRVPSQVYPEWTQLKREPGKAFSYSDWASIMQEFLVLDDGIPGGMDRYGNSVVPQIPELIGRAIMKAESMTPTHKEEA